MSRHGLKMNEPCDICGETSDTRSDSWFCYTTCAKHDRVPPAYKDVAKREFEVFGRTQWDIN